MNVWHYKTFLSNGDGSGGYGDGSHFIFVDDHFSGDDYYSAISRIASSLFLSEILDLTSPGSSDTSGGPIIRDF